MASHYVQQSMHGNELTKLIPGAQTIFLCLHHAKEVGVKFKYS